MTPRLKSIFAFRGSMGLATGGIHASAVDSAPVGDADAPTLRRILRLIRPYGGHLAVILVLLVSSALLNLATPILLQRIVDDALPSRDLWLFASLCLAMLAAPLGADFLDIGEKYLTTYVGERVTFDLRNRVYRQLQRQPLGYFASARPGHAVSSVLNDVQGIGSVVSDKVIGIAQNVTVFCASAVMLVLLEPRFAAVALLLLPAFAVPTRRVARTRKELKRQAQEQVAGFVGLLSETLSTSGALLLRVFGTEEIEAARVEATSREIMRLSLRQAMVGRWFRLLLGFLQNVGPALLWGYGGYLVMSGEIGLGTVVASAALLKKLYAPAAGLLTVYVDLVTSYAYFERIFAVLDLEPSIRDAPDARRVTRVRGALAFRGVSFAYRPGLEALSNIDLDIAPGECIALVGASGSGKSTLAALIARLHDPTSGAILLDGHDLRDLKLKDLRAQIGVVTQETYLLHASLRENIRYGRPDATDEEVEAAACAAQLHEVVAALPDGYDTIVGDRGCRLSGGERQRVAIARVILRAPRILILDEATSALDSQNEALIQAALEPVMRGRTTLLVAHRLSTIRNADVVAVLDRGRVVERGRHHELLAKGGAYARLWQEQSLADAGRDDKEAA